MIATAGKTRARVVHDLADALQELATSAALRQRLGAGAIERAQEFAWSKLVGEVYAEIAAPLPTDRAGSAAPAGVTGRGHAPEATRKGNRAA